MSFRPKMTYPNRVTSSRSGLRSARLTCSAQAEPEPSNSPGSSPSRWTTIAEPWQGWSAVLLHPCFSRRGPAGPRASTVEDRTMIGRGNIPLLAPVLVLGLLFVRAGAGQTTEGHTIIGKVRTQSGRPIPNVLVQLEAGNGVLIAQTVTTN